MKPFMDADFLLQTDTAKTLYHEAAEKMPIFDYHNHLNPQEILEDRQMENLTRVWLGGDHYNGVPACDGLFGGSDHRKRR